MNRKNKMRMYLSYIWIFAVGLTMLYSFSLLPRATGYTALQFPRCESYFEDKICDDSREDCGSAYIEGESLVICNECQTGGFDC